jgi:hypothetical protein
VESNKRKMPKISQQMKKVVFLSEEKKKNSKFKITKILRSGATTKL